MMNNRWYRNCSSDDGNNNEESVGGDCEFGDEFEKAKSDRKIFKILAFIFYLLMALLFLTSLIRTYQARSVPTWNQFHCEDAWSDVVISTITWSSLIIGAFLIGKSLRQFQANVGHQIIPVEDQIHQINQPPANQPNQSNHLVSDNYILRPNSGLEPVDKFSRVWRNNQRELWSVRSNGRPNLRPGSASPWLGAGRHDYGNCRRSFSMGFADPRLNI